MWSRLSLADQHDSIPREKQAKLAGVDGSTHIRFGLWRGTAVGAKIIIESSSILRSLHRLEQGIVIHQVATFELGALMLLVPQHPLKGAEHGSRSR